MIDDALRRKLAQQAYEAYVGTSTDFITAWDQLDPNVREDWERVVDHLAAALPAQLLALRATSEAREVVRLLWATVRSQRGRQRG